NIKTEGTINIAIAWDTTYAMSIEYNIPLIMLETSTSELKYKKISIGWKINEIINTTQPANVTSRIVGVRVTSNTPTPNRNTPSSRSADVSQSTSNKAQSIWTVHTISF